MGRFRKLLRATILAITYSPMMFLDILLFVLVSDRRRFMEPSEYPELSVIEHAFPEIREELMVLLEERDQIPGFADVEEGQVRLAGDGRWKTVMFRMCGLDVPENWKRCPRTATAIGQVPGINIAMFSILAPGKHLPKHVGSMKGMLPSTPRTCTTAKSASSDATRNWRSWAPDPSARNPTRRVHSATKAEATILRAAASNSQGRITWRFVSASPSGEVTKPVPVTKTSKGGPSPSTVRAG